MKSLSDISKKVNGVLEKSKLLKTQVSSEKKSLEKAQKQLDHAKAAAEFILEFSKHVQQESHSQIANIVSRCLSEVFDEPYEFKIDFIKKAARTEAQIYFEKDGNTVDPLTASGGGVVDVADFALRIASILLSKPQLRRFLILDEPFRFVSAEYAPRVRDMLLSLAHDFDFQILMVTHSSDLEIGNVIRLK